MDKKFSLIEQLNETKNEKLENKNPFPPGIEYQEYTLDVEGKEIDIFIPLRECHTFENALNNMTKYLDKDALCDLLREHRGIKSYKE